MNTKKKKKSSKSCYITKGYGKSNGRVLKDKLEASVNYKDRKNDPRSQNFYHSSPAKSTNMIAKKQLHPEYYAAIYLPIFYIAPEKDQNQ